MERIELTEKSVSKGTNKFEENNATDVPRVQKRLLASIALAYIIAITALGFGLYAFLQMPSRNAIAEMSPDFGATITKQHSKGESSEENGWKKAMEAMQKKLEFMSKEHEESREEILKVVERIANGTKEVFGLYDIMNNSLIEIKEETEKNISRVTDDIHSAFESKLADVKELMEIVQNSSRHNEQKILAKVDRKYSDTKTSTASKFAEFENDLTALESDVVGYMKQNITSIMSTTKKQIAKNISEVADVIHSTFEAKLADVKELTETVWNSSRDNDQKIMAIREEISKAVERMANGTEEVFGLYSTMNNSFAELKEETDKNISRVTNVIHSTFEAKFADVKELMETVRNSSRDNEQRIMARVDRKYSDTMTSTGAKIAELKNDLTSLESNIVEYVKQNVPSVMNTTKKEIRQEISEVAERIANRTEEVFGLYGTMNNSLVELKEETAKNISEVTDVIHLTFEAKLADVKELMETVRNSSRDNAAKVDRKYSNTKTSTDAKFAELRNDLTSLESNILKYVKQNITAIMSTNSEAIEEMQTNLEKNVDALKYLFNKSQDIEEKFNALQMNASDELHDTKQGMNEVIQQTSSALVREIGVIRNDVIGVASNLSEEISRTNLDTSALEETIDNITSTLWRQLSLVKSNLVSVERNLTFQIEDQFKNSQLHAKSCKELRNRGVTVDGIYSIVSGNTTSVFQVFCDMTTSSGGWTLVASIHEDNIWGNCTIGDKWSSEQGISAAGNGANWMNLNTFGNILSATGADYKSPAYFSVNASDVMVWHVKNDVPIDKMPEEAYLYVTRNGFLNRYGGSLLSLFSTISHQTPSGAELINKLDLIYQHNDNGKSMILQLANRVSNWYEYKYDQGTTAKHISDGGSDMYDGGNKVYYKVESDNFRQVTYGENLQLNNSYRISSFAYHPFVFLMWIDNRQTGFESYSIKVVSNAGADGGGSFTETYQSSSYNTLTARYYVYCVSGASDPSICGVMFYVYDEKKWCSKKPTTFLKGEWTTTTDDMTHSVSVTGAPTNILMGYILLSRSNDDAVSWSQVSSVMYTMLQHIDSVDITDYAFPHMDKTTVDIPVSFVRGTSAPIPPGLTSYVSSGFIQFSSLHQKDEQFAFCPGVKANKCFAAQYVCVGGFKNSNNANICGDYAGWMGRPQDTILKDRANGYAHSQDQIDSTLLIFTR